MKTTLYLMRHGAPEVNLARPPVLQGRGLNLPLASLGVRQAEATRDFLAIWPIDRCYCSPLLRAEQTATIVAAPHGLAPAPLEEELQLSPYILQAMLVGANKPFNTAIIYPEMEGLRRYSQEHGLPPYLSMTELIANPEIEKLIEAEVDRISAGWKSYERPRRVLLVDQEWTIDNDMLTPTLKVKRARVTQRYNDLLEQQFTVSPPPAPGATLRQEPWWQEEMAPRRPGARPRSCSRSAYRLRRPPHPAVSPCESVSGANGRRRRRVRELH